MLALAALLAQIIVGGSSGGGGAAAVKTKTVVCIGDSTTYGAQNGGTGRWTTPFCEQLGSLLGSGYAVNNQGVSGYTTAQMLTLWTNTVRALQSDYVIVMGGINDVSTQTDTAIFSNLSTIYNQAIADGHIVVALTMGPNGALAGGFQQVRHSVNARIINYVNTAATGTAYLYDESQLMTRLTTPLVIGTASASTSADAMCTALNTPNAGCPYNYSSGDGLHQNQAGHTDIGNALKTNAAFSAAALPTFPKPQSVSVFTRSDGATIFRGNGPGTNPSVFFDSGWMNDFQYAFMWCRDDNSAINNLCNNANALLALDANGTGYFLNQVLTQGGIRAGTNGTLISQSARVVTGTIVSTAVAAGAVGTIATVAMTGAAAGTECRVGLPVAPANALVYGCYVTAGNCVIYASNPSAGALSYLGGVYSCRADNP